MSETKSKPSNVDDLLTLIDRGVWNVPFYVITCMVFSLNAVSLVEMEFISSLTTEKPNMNISGFSNQSDEAVLADTQQIHSVSYTSFTDEFKLHPPRDHLRSLYQMMFGLGGSLGSFPIAVIANRYGCRNTIFCGSVLLLVMTVLSLVVPWFEALMVIRFMIGIGFVAVFRPSISLGLECSTPKRRPVLGFVTALGFPCSVAIIPLLALISENWRVIHLLASFPIYMLFIFSNPMLLKESPRWLVERGRIKEAALYLQRAARLNGRENVLPTDLEDILEEIHTKDRYQRDEATSKSSGSFSSTLSDLFATKPMRTLSIITALNGLFIATALMALPLRTKLSKSPYIFLLVLGLSEVPASTLIVPVTQRFGRVKLYSVLSLLITVLQLVLSIIIYYQVDNDTVITCLSAFIHGVADCMVMLYNVYTSEVFPTSVRSFASCMAHSMICLGYNIPPLLEIIIPSQYFSWLSLVVYSIFTTIGGIVILHLPETNKKPLLQTVENYVHLMAKKQKKHIKQSL